MADEFDLAHLPSGQLAWRALVEHVSNIDATAERHFFELKSEINLNNNEGRAKVAKFILGAANREPEVAASRFDGRALMFLGIGTGTTPGIEGFEAMELQHYVRKFTGTPGPEWDFERIDIGNDRAVIVVIVGPPDAEKQPWMCESQGPANLNNGRIFIRGDGDTREATADEARAMVARSKTAAQPQVELAIEIVGSVRSYDWDEAVFDEYIARKREWLLDAFPDPEPTQTRTLTVHERQALGVNVAAMLAAATQAQRATYGLMGSSTPDNRTEEEYRAQIDKWEADARKAMPAILDTVAGYVWDGVTVRIRNLTDTYLEQPEIRIHLDGPVDGLKKESEIPDLLGELPSPPRRWGPVSNVSSLLGGIGPNFGANLRPNFPTIAPGPYNVVRFDNGGSVDLEFTLKELRPRGSSTTDDDEFVLIAREEGVTEFRGNWQVTVRGHNAVYEGELVVPVSANGNDFSTWIRNTLMPEDDTESDGD